MPAIPLRNASCLLSQFCKRKFISEINKSATSGKQVEDFKNAIRNFFGGFDFAKKSEDSEVKVIFNLFTSFSFPFILSDPTSNAISFSVLLFCGHFTFCISWRRSKDRNILQESLWYTTGICSILTYSNNLKHSHFLNIPSRKVEEAFTQATRQSKVGQEGKALTPSQGGIPTTPRPKQQGQCYWSYRTMVIKPNCMYGYYKVWSSRIWEAKIYSRSI